MSSNISYSLEPISWKFKFKCSDSDDSFYIFMNSLDIDDLISLGENVKEVVNNQKDSYDSKNDVGEVHVSKNLTTINSFLPGFDSSTLKTKYYLNIITTVLINYEILDDDSVLDGFSNVYEYICSVIDDRLLPENALTKLKKKEVKQFK